MTFGMRGEGRSGNATSPSLGVIGNESELAEFGRREGRTGIVNVFGISDAESEVSSGKWGEVGVVAGVLRRTYVEIGMFAARSLVDP